MNLYITFEFTLPIEKVIPDLLETGYNRYDRDFIQDVVNPSLSKNIREYKVNIEVTENFNDNIATVLVRLVEKDI